MFCNIAFRDIVFLDFAGFDFASFVLHLMISCRLVSGVCDFALFINMLVSWKFHCAVVMLRLEVKKESPKDGKALGYYAELALRYNNKLRIGAGQEPVTAHWVEHCCAVCSKVFIDNLKNRKLNRDISAFQAFYDIAIFDFRIFVCRFL